MVWHSHLLKNFPQFIVIHTVKAFGIVNKTEVGNDNPVCETAKEPQMYRTVFWTLGEGEGGMIWENGIETCIISCVK